jgi:uncharacterized protein YhjY with autotransporter beta-barrel domain
MVNAPALTTVQAVATTTLTSGTAATAFTPVTASGGFGSISYAVSPALPAGLSFSTSTGQITGTPTVLLSAANFTVTVTDSATPTAQTSSKTFSLTVDAPAFTTTQAVATATLTSGTAATAFTPVTASGGFGSISYSVSPSLPAGLNFSASTGQISGTPTALLTASTFTVTATDGTTPTAQTSSKSFSLTVNAPGLVATQAVPTTILTAGSAATAFTPVTASGGFGTLSYTVSPALPSGLTLSSSTGQITGTPTALLVAATFTMTVTDSATPTAQTATKTFALTVNAPALTTSQAVATTTLTSGTAATAFTPVTASGGFGTISYSVSPALPTGLNFSSSTGQVSGTPTVLLPATTFTLTATDNTTPTAQTSTKTFSLTVNAPALATTQAVPTTTLASGTAATAFTPVTASGGFGAINYAVSPALPTGLSFSTSTGQISGTPTVLLTATTFTVTATDSTTPTAQTSSKTFALTVTAPDLTTAQAVPATSLTAGSAATAFKPVSASGGFGTVTYAISPALPTGLSFSSSTGQISGTPTVLLSAATFTVTATDSTTPTAQTSSKTFSLTVGAPGFSTTQAVATTTLTVNSAASAFTPVTASGGFGTISYAVSPALPTGLNFSTLTGQISGTPTVLLSSTIFTVTATDSTTPTAQTSFKTFTLVVNAPALTTSQAVATMTLTSGTAATAFTPVTASGGFGTIGYSISPALPAGLSFNTTTGAITGTPTVLLTAMTFTVTATDSTTPSAQTSSKTFSLTVNAPGLVTTQAVATTTLTSGTAATAFTPVTASGGFGTLSYAVSPALPTGLGFSTSTGQITGKPTVLLPATTFTVTVTDSATPTAQVSSKSFALTVNAPGLVTTQAVATTTLTSGTAATAFTPVTASGGFGTVSYAISPALPAGLTFSASTGAITGKPTALLSATTFTVTVTDSATPTAQTSSKTFSLTVNAPGLVTTQAVATTTVTSGTAVTAFTPVTASGGFGTISYAVSPALPAGLTFNTTTGTIAGKPTGLLSATTFTVTATDSTTPTAQSSSKTFSLTVGAPAFATIQAVATTTLTVNSPATAFTPVTASGGFGAISYAVSPALPSGLKFSKSTGQITGKATALLSATTFTVTATDSTTPTAQTSSKTFTLTVVAPVLVTTQAVPSTTLTSGTAAPAFTPVTASGGFGTIAYAISPTLPAGLTFNTTTGAIAGTPTAPLAVTKFTVTAKDSSTPTAQTSSKTFNLTVKAPILTISADAAHGTVVGEAYSQSNSASGGSGAYLYALAKGTLPAGTRLNAKTGVVSGTLTAAGPFSYAIKVTDGETTPQSATASTVSGTITPRPNVITFAQAAVTFGTAPFELTGTANSGLKVSYASNSPAVCTVTGNGRVTLLKAGACSITASQAGNASYAAAKPVTVVFKVTAGAPVAVADRATTPANSPVTIAVAANDTNAVTGIAIAAAPSHGTAAVSGLNVIYTPHANYFGADSFTYTATGPGGKSAPATVSVAVKPLTVPTVGPLALSTTVATKVDVIATATAKSGPFTAVAVVAEPAHGTAVVAGLEIYYTPSAGFTGTDSFTYTVANAFGVSRPATATITVNAASTAPSGASSTLSTAAQTPVRISLTHLVPAGTYQSAVLVGLSPPNAGTVAIIVDGQSASLERPSSKWFDKLIGIPSAHADTVGHTYEMMFTPAKGFVGTAEASITLVNAMNQAVPVTIRIEVGPTHTDPSADPTVNGLLSAQADAAKRFAQKQISNIARRLESLHDHAASMFSNGLQVGFGGLSNGSRGDSDRDDAAEPSKTSFSDIGSTSNSPVQTGQPARGNSSQTNASRAASSGKASDAPTARGAKSDESWTDQFDRPSKLAFWTGGGVDFAHVNSSFGQLGNMHTTIGITVGADYRFSDQFMLGVAVGYDHETADIGTDGSRNISSGFNAAMYGSVSPFEKTYIDFIAGGSTLSFDSQRVLTGATDLEVGHRGGQQFFGSLIGSYDLSDDVLKVTSYGRLEASSSTLNRFTETGDSFYALNYSNQSVTSLAAALGVRGSYSIPVEYGVFDPRVRLEYMHDFEGSSYSNLSYVSDPSTIYRTTTTPFGSNSILFGIGTDLRLSGFTLGVDYEAAIASQTPIDHTIRFQISTQY